MRWEDDSIVSYGRLRKEAMMAYFKLLFWHLP
jgi:hypothetical protein